MDISNAQIAELEAHVEDVDIKAAEEEERRTKHDVMAHLHVFAAQCPLAGPIIHVGATSCYIGDNTVSFNSWSSWAVDEIPSYLTNPSIMNNY